MIAMSLYKYHESLNTPDSIHRQFCFSLELEELSKELHEVKRRREK